MKPFATRLCLESLEHRRLLAARAGDGLCLDFLCLDQNQKQVVAQDVDRVGDSFGTALDLGVLTSDYKILETVGGLDPVDVFRFELTKQQELVLELAETSSSAALFVFGADGRLITRGNQTTETSETIERTFSLGHYYALVLPQSGNVATYQFTIDVPTEAPTPPPMEVLDAANTFGTATKINRLPFTRTETLGHGSDSADVFRFDIGSAGQLRVELTNLTDNLDLFLFKTTGELAGRNYQSGMETESVNMTAEIGSYFALVLPHGRVSGRYELHVSVSPVAQQDPIPNDPPNPPPNESPNLSVPLSNAPYFGGSREWNLNSIRAPEAWSAGFYGQNVLIAVLDTGVDRNHPDLRPNIWRNTSEIPGDRIDNDGNGFVDDLYGWNFSDDNNNTFDANAHGTHIAGVLASTRNDFGNTGVAYRAKVMPIRILDATGYGTNRNVARGIRYAVDNGAHLINLSFISPSHAGMYNAIKYAHSKNVLVVAASGNEFRETPRFPARLSSVLDNVISVGSYDTKLARASFSNRVGNSGAVQVDAPGRSIYSTIPNNRYAYYKGTSMSTPHVTGIAALALSANPGLSASRLRQLIVDGARQPITGSDSQGGINAAFTVPLAFNRPTAVAAAIALEPESLPSRQLDSAAIIATWRFFLPAKDPVRAAGSVELPTKNTAFSYDQTVMRESSIRSKRPKDHLVDEFFDGAYTL